MKIDKLIPGLSRSGTARSGEALAKDTIKAHRGDMGAVLSEIISDRHAPGARRERLMSMVDHSDEFRRYLGIHRPDILERTGIHHSSSNFRVQSQIIAPRALAEVATLESEHATRALDRLEELLMIDVSLEPRSRIRFGEAAAEGFVCLAEHLPSMPPALAQRAARIIEGNTSCLPEQEQRRVYNACSRLPATQNEAVGHLANLARQRQQKARAEMTASRDNAIRSRLLAPAPSSRDAYPEIIQKIFDEAARRGIHVTAKDRRGERYTLSHGGATYDCFHSQTPLTPASAIELCGDKMATAQFLKSRGIPVPRQFAFEGDHDAAVRFLKTCESGLAVVKPSRGVGGKGVSIGVTEKDLAAAIAYAGKDMEASGKVLIEEFHKGEDLRLLVINYELVAAARRRPPEIEGDGTSTIRALIQKNRVLMDEETERCLEMEKLGYDSVLDAGRTVQVRKNANTSTGGTIEDVTPELDPRLRQAAETAAREMKMPVVGFDFLVESPEKYVVIEANEAPSLANHEPQPVVQRFLDLLFPHAIDCT